ncbi:MAG: anaerobic ribonucleoside-triphosphate reductase activating protein [Lachnospiraceae bacterium]|nr:anaerobic ribonucleoside-triphosphate reductase activating protein [Lachnospiraceae bacterium]
MFFCGLNKTTLLDYPGHLACTIFLGGCNFRCPYCQNKDLLLHPADYAAYTESDIFDHLTKRRGILHGVCITGGEPTLNPELASFIRKIKDLGYLVKLDTNGTHPDMVKMLYEEHLIDYVAMDIKADPKGYAASAGLPKQDDTLFSKVQETVRFLMEDAKRPGFDFEFRTTVVKELHDEATFQGIAEWIKGAPHYFLQSYQESEGVLVPGFSAYPEAALQDFVSLIKPKIPSVEIRGV